MREVLGLKTETGARKDEMHGQFRSYGTRGYKKKQFSKRAGFLFWGFVAFLCLLHSEIVLRCISSLFIILAMFFWACIEIRIRNRKKLWDWKGWKP